MKIYQNQTIKNNKNQLKLIKKSKNLEKLIKTQNFNKTHKFEFPSFVR